MSSVGAGDDMFAEVLLAGLCSVDVCSRAFCRYVVVTSSIVARRKLSKS